MKDIDDTTAPLLDHLIELRRRLLMSLGVLVVLFFYGPLVAAVVVADSGVQRSNQRRPGLQRGVGESVCGLDPQTSAKGP